MFTVDCAIDVLRVICKQVNSGSDLTDADVRTIDSLLWTLNNSLCADQREAKRALDELRCEWLKEKENA